MSQRNFGTALAEWSAAAGAMPEAARAEVRLAVLDTVGCIMAGWDEPQTVAARKAAGQPVNAPAKALILGTSAHALDFDDYEVPGSTHPSAPILGALLALAEAEPVSWGRLLDAYVVGYEAIVRLGEAVGYDHYEAGWHATGTLGTLGAAAASAKLLGLPAAGIAAALSLATSMSAGLKLQFGSDAKALHAGLAARAGIEAARLAEAGASASSAVFDGPYGFFYRYDGSKTRAIDEAVARIGRRLGLEQHPILRKPWPSCAYSHRAIEAALTISGATPGLSDAVDEVTLRIPEPFFRVAGFLRPSNSTEARFSVVYCIAAALIDGAITPASFDPKAFTRPAVSALLDKIRVEAYDPGPGVEDMSPAHPDTVSVVLDDGRRLSHTTAEVAGGAARPMSLAQLKGKFTACGGTQALADTILGVDPAQPFQVAVTETGPRFPALEPAA